MSKEAALLADIERLLRAPLGTYRRWIVGVIVDAFLSLIEPQPIDRPGSRLIENPSNNGATFRSVGRCSSPHIVEDVDCQLFSGFPIAGDPHDQREHDSMRPRVKRMQRKLVASANRLNECDPILLGNGRLGLIGIEQVAQGCLARTTVLVRGWSRHGPS